MLDVKDFLYRIPTKKLNLRLYKKWRLDKDKLLLNNFIRFKKMNSKSIDHYAVQEKYYFIYEILNKLYSRKKNLDRRDWKKKIYYALLKILNYPLIYIPRNFTFELKLYFHRFIYYWSKLILLIFRYLPNTINLTIWKKKFESVNIIAFINKKQGFTEISKLALKYYVSYYYILKRIEPDLVLIYNGNWATSTTLSAACEKLDICHYFTESSSFIGYSHLDSTAIWFDGDINKLKLPEWSEEREIELNKKISEYLNDWRRGIASAAEDDKVIDTKIPENKFIFLPMQMMDDTNNIKYSPIIEDILHLVKVIVRNTPKEYDIVVKRHPWDTVFADPLYWRCLKEIKKIAREYENVHLYHYADSQVLLKRCELLITANSTLSLENLFEARAPIMVFGDNFIRGWGFTYDINHLDEFPLKLKLALEKKVTPEMETKMKQFLYLYFFKVLVKGHAEIKFNVHDKQGNIIKKVHLPAEYRFIANRLLEEISQIQERKIEGLRRRLQDLKKFRCMIDRTKIPNYKGVILDYKP